MFRIRPHAPLALLALVCGTSASAADCHKFFQGRDFVGRTADKAPTLSQCFPSADAVKDELWRQLKSVIEAPIDYGDMVEKSTVTPGGCAPFSQETDGSFTHRCTYTVQTVQRSKTTDYQYGFSTDSYFGVSMKCGAAMNTTWRSDLGLCMGYRDVPAAQTCQSTAERGNPINVLTGQKSQREHVLSWGRQHALVLTYAPLDERNGLSRYRGSTPRFGPLWHSNLHKQGLQNGGGAGFVAFQRGDGTMSTFDDYGATRTSSVERDRARWDSTLGAWLYYDMAASAIERYGAGQVNSLRRVHYADGRYLDIRYGVALVRADANLFMPVISEVADESGRVVKFAYEPDPTYFSTLRVSMVTDPAGREYKFAYEASGAMAAILSPDGTVRGYLYERADLPWAITARIDEDGARYGTYDYDAAGRAISTATGTRGERWQVSWPNPPEWLITTQDDNASRRIVRKRQASGAVQATLTGPDGRTEVVEGAPLSGSPMLKSQSQPAGAGCEAANSSLKYDGEGNVIERVDFNGNQSCHAYVAGRQLESSRVEGLPVGAACATLLGSGAPMPAGARKLSSEWHPLWRMATRKAEPRRITTLVYNGQPDRFNGNVVASCAPADAVLPDGKPIVVLCKQVEQATTDDTGAQGFNAALQAGVAARVTSWAYNATGQVLTETDPRGKVVATNVYYADTTADHTKGDLQSSTNARGHVVQFPRYDAYGKPLEMVDANGIPTAYAYDARQRLLSVSSQGQSTNYEYWPTGLLKKSTQTDGSTASYEYDDAHRLVAVADSLGNRIEYTLDASGNRTDEKA
ncbi:hypothetical protein N5D62_26205, partial [Mitsuaria sp. GD03876]|nr:hypothetical protein [Mitsuaria sp. GD03876]